MSAALRLVEDLEPAPSSGRSARVTMHPTMRATPSMRPTLVPSSRPSVQPLSLATMRVTEAPTTQRSASNQPRLEAVARIEARNILGIMRCNVSFLESLLRGNAPLDALAALEDLHQGLDRLEDRFASSLPLALTRLR